jgi:hypothetical protein
MAFVVDHMVIAYMLHSRAHRLHLSTGHISHPIQCLLHSILASTNVQVDSYNNQILNRLRGKDRIYIAADSLKEQDNIIENAQDNNIQFSTPDTILDYVAHQRP